MKDMVEEIYALDGKLNELKIHSSQIQWSSDSQSYDQSKYISIETCRLIN